MYEVEIAGSVVVTTKLYDALRFIDSYGRPVSASVAENKTEILLKRDGKEIHATIRYPPVAKEHIEYELFGRGLL